MYLTVVSAEVIFYSIFVLYFSEYLRFQYLHFLYHMHSPEYKESLKRQIEEQKVWKLIVVYSVRISFISHAKAVCLHCYV